MCPRFSGLHGMERLKFRVWGGLRRILKRSTAGWRRLGRPRRHLRSNRAKMCATSGLVEGRKTSRRFGGQRNRRAALGGRAKAPVPTQSKTKLTTEDAENPGSPGNLDPSGRVHVPGVGGLSCCPAATSQYNRGWGVLYNSGRPSK